MTKIKFASFPNPSKGKSILAADMLLTHLYYEQVCDHAAQLTGECTGCGITSEQIIDEHIVFLEKENMLDKAQWWREVQSRDEEQPIALIAQIVETNKEFIEGLR